MHEIDKKRIILNNPSNLDYKNKSDSLNEDHSNE